MGETARLFPCFPLVVSLDLDHSNHGLTIEILVCFVLYRDCCIHSGRICGLWIQRSTFICTFMGFLLSFHGSVPTKCRDGSRTRRSCAGWVVSALIWFEMISLRFVELMALICWCSSHHIMPTGTMYNILYLVTLIMMLMNLIIAILTTAYDDALEEAEVAAAVQQVFHSDSSMFCNSNCELFNCNIFHG